MRYYDVSLLLTHHLIHWPEEQGLRSRKVHTLAKDGVEVTDFSLGSHTGTHIDAPRHFVKNAGSVDEIAFDKLIGPALVIEVRPKKGRTIEPGDISLGDWKRAERIFLKTSNSKKLNAEQFTDQYISLSLETAQLMVRKGVKLVGVDYLSVEKKGSTGHPVHMTLLKAGIVIVEGCILAHVPAGRYQCAALPLKLKGFDGSPCRVVLMR